MSSIYPNIPRRFLNYFSCCLHPATEGGRAAAETKQLGSEVLEAFPVIIYGDSSNCPFANSFDSECCCICLAEFSGGESLRVLPKCGHVFHKRCIDLWLLARSLNCPVCRDQSVDRKEVLRKSSPVSNDDGGSGGRRTGVTRPRWYGNTSTLENFNLAGNAHRFSFF